MNSSPDVVVVGVVGAGMLGVVGESVVRFNLMDSGSTVRSWFWLH